MSSDESLTRLQNALATLAEMAARSQEVDAQHEARLNSLEESNKRIAETNLDLAKSNRRITETNRDLAESNRLIVEMIRRHDERLDESQAARDEIDQKLAALVDAQIRGEDEMTRLRGAMAELSEAQARTEATVERLSRTVETSIRDGRGGQSPG